MRADPLFIGLDVGTSGARAVVIDEMGATRSDGRASMAEFGTNPRDPLTWLAAVEGALGAALTGIARSRVAAIAVDGTSGSLVPVNVKGVIAESVPNRTLRVVEGFSARVS